MSESIQNPLQKEIEEVTNSLGSSGISRQDFFKYVGVAGAAMATVGFVACEDEGTGPVMSDAVFLGNGNVGVLNYAYALEQLEAAFYVQVIASQYAGMTSAERELLTDIRDHEVAHADFYSAALGAIAPDSKIPGLTPNFSAVDFTNRASVLGTALTFENVGVSAYNGAGPLLTDAGLLLVAGKIVSVEARHSAAISDLVRPDAGVSGNKLIGSGPIIDANGLDVSRSVADVLGIVKGFVEETIDASGLPQPQ